MRELDGREFWLYVDRLLSLRKMSLGDFCEKAGVSYSTVSYQRVRHAFPKIEQLVAMANLFKISIEELVTGELPSSVYPPRVRAIAQACLIAPDDDLRLVEKVLGIEEKKAASSAG